jgi:hypothetical protein
LFGGPGFDNPEIIDDLDLVEPDAPFGPNDPYNEQYPPFTTGYDEDWDRVLDEVRAVTIIDMHSVKIIDGFPSIWAAGMCKYRWPLL